MVISSFYWFIYLIFKLLSNLKIMKNCHFNIHIICLFKLIAYMFQTYSSSTTFGNGGFHVSVRRSLYWLLKLKLHGGLHVSARRSLYWLWDGFHLTVMRFSPYENTIPHSWCLNICSIILHYLSFCFCSFWFCVFGCSFSMIFFIWLLCIFFINLIHFNTYGSISMKH